MQDALDWLNAKASGQIRERSAWGQEPVGPLDPEDPLGSLRAAVEPTIGEKIGGFFGGIGQGFFEGGAGGTLKGLGVLSEKLNRALGSDAKSQIFTPAGEAVSRFGESMLPENPLAAGGLTTKAGQALGQGLGFMAGGLAVRGALRLGTTAAVATQGALANGAAGYYEALASGSTEQEAWESFLGNAAVGTTEAVPLAGILTRIDRRTGGGLKQVALRALAEGGEEAAQESFQQVMGNIIAQELYDEEREIFEGVAEGGALGAFAGVVLSALGSGASRALQPRADQPGPLQGPPQAPLETFQAYAREVGGEGLTIVGPQTPGQERIAQRFSALGMKVGFIQGAPADAPSGLVTPEGALFRADIEDVQLERRYVTHELSHVLRQQVIAELAGIQGPGLLGSWEKLYQELQELDPEGIKATEQDVEALYGEITPDEVVANYLEQIGYTLFDERLEEALQKPNLAVRIIDAVLKALGIRGIQDRKLDAIFQSVREKGLPKEKIPEIKSAVDEAFAQLHKVERTVQKESPVVTEAAAQEQEVATLPTEEGIFGKQEKPPAPRKQTGPPVEVSAPQMFDVQEGDLPGQTTIQEVTEKPKEKPKTTPRERGRKARKKRVASAGSLREFVRLHGGLQYSEDFSQLYEDERAEGRPKPGESRMVQSAKSKKGMTLDDAIEAALEAGFFPGETKGTLDPQRFRDALEEDQIRPDMLDEFLEQEELEAARRKEELRRYYEDEDYVPFARSLPGTYSKLEKEINQKATGKRVTAGQLKAMLRKTVGEEEWEWSGLDDFLAGRSSVTKEEVQAFLEANNLAVEEVTLGEKSDPTQYDRWKAAPGGENYRELLVKMPGRDVDTTGWTAEKQGAYYQVRDAQGKDVQHLRANGPGEAIADAAHRLGRDRANFTGGHFEGHENILFHVRFDERGDTLFVQEIQSDWHQKGRKEGYAGKGGPAAFNVYDGRFLGGELLGSYSSREAAESSFDDIADESGVAPRFLEIREEVDRHDVAAQVPDAPFKRTWPILAMKRMIRWASEHGFDKLGWTPGILQVERYSDATRQVVDSVDWGLWQQGLRRVHLAKNGNTVGMLHINDQGVVQSGHGSHPAEFVGETIEDVLGKEIARQIISEESGAISGDNLAIGGKGMQDFYDKILVNAANKLGKRHGARVERGEVGTNVNIGDYLPHLGAAARSLRESGKTKAQARVALEEAYPLKRQTTDYELHQERRDLEHTQTMPVYSETAPSIFAAPVEQYSEEAKARRFERHKNRIERLKRRIKELERERYTRQEHGAALDQVYGKEIHVLPITDALREQAMGEGFSQFARSRPTKVVDEQGRPKVVYHGAQRPDRIGNRFYRSRATSGPMPFFTDDPEIAGGYAKGKQDTSLDIPESYSKWFLYKIGRSKVPIDQAWFHLTSEERQRVRSLYYRVSVSDPETGEPFKEGARVLPEGEVALTSADHWDYVLQREARGNPLAAMVDVWLDSGNLYGQEIKFLELLKTVGLDPKRIEFADPNAEHPGIFPVYLFINNPLDTSKIPDDVVAALREAGKRKRGKKGQGADLWDKNYISGPDWLSRLDEDLETGSSYAWTSIPDWVTDVLELRFGYDGIQDKGGKYADHTHDVWIPFRPNQIKSATGNRGTFDPSSPDIRYARSLPIHTAKRSLKKFFTSSGLIPEPVFERAISKDGWIREHIQRSENLWSDVARLKLDDDKLDKALRNPVLMNGMPLEVRVLRDHLDELSQHLIDKGVFEGKLAAHVAANKGVYLTRSYQVFDDPKWAEKVPEDVRNRAKAALRQEYPGLSEERINAKIDNLLYEGKAADTPMAQAAVLAKKLGAKDLSIARKRKDLPEWLRDLYGEYKDPKINYLRSVAKMSQLIANHQFLTELKGTEWFRKSDTSGVPPTGEHTVRIAAEGSEVMAPLNGYWTTPDIKEAFEDYYRTEPLPAWLQWMLTANAVSKYGKTVGSVMTHVRNFTGNIPFMVAQGHWAIARYGKEGFGGVLVSMNSKNAKQFRTMVSEALRLNVIHESVTAGELRDAVNEAAGLSDKGVLKFFTRLYQAGDNFWKIAAWKMEQDRGYSPEEAARIVRNTFPTYSLVPRAIKLLRRFPLAGPFVSFPAEVTRTAYQTLKLINEELRAPEAWRRKVGAQRLVGTLMAATLPAGAALTARMLQGMSADDDDKAREFLPPWSKNSNILWLGTNKDGSKRYIDVSYSDPYSYLKEPLKAMSRGEDWQEKLVDSLASLMEPYISEEIAAGSVLDVLRNRTKTGKEVYNEAGSPAQQTVEIAAHLWDAVEPGTISSLQRVAKGVQGEVTAYGRDYDPAIEALAMTTGVRVSSMSVPQSLSFLAGRYSSDLGRSTSMLSTVAGRMGNVPDNEIRDAWEKMESNRQRHFRKMLNAVHAARALGIRDDEIFSALDSRLSAEKARDLMAGRYRSYRPSSSFLATRLTDPEVRRERLRLIRELSNAPE